MMIIMRDATLWICLHTPIAIVRQEQQKGKKVIMDFSHQYLLHNFQWCYHHQTLPRHIFQHQGHPSPPKKLSSSPPIFWPFFNLILILVSNICQTVWAKGLRQVPTCGASWGETPILFVWGEECPPFYSENVPQLAPHHTWIPVSTYGSNRLADIRDWK